MRSYGQCGTGLLHYGRSWFLDGLLTTDADRPVRPDDYPTQHDEDDIWDESQGGRHEQATED